MLTQNIYVLFFLFGTNGLVASHIALSSYEIVFLRTLLGSLSLIACYIITRQPITFHKYKQQFVFLVISGAAMGTSWMFLYEAYQQIGVSVASLMYYCGPILVMLLSPVLFKEKLTFCKVAGFLAVFLGLCMVNGKLVQEGNSTWGIFCGFMSAVMYAFMVIFNKKSKQITGLENSMIQLTVSFLTVAVFVGMKQQFVIHAAPSDWFPILMLGLVNTGIGCYLYFSPLSQLPIQTVSVCGYLEPLSAVLFSVIVLQEKMMPMQIVGAVLILGGAVWSECGRMLTQHRIKTA